MRGFVRDLRLRCASKEAGLAHDVRTIPFEGREANHLSHQPFGQVPFLGDGGLQLVESGAGLLHLARKSEWPSGRPPFACHAAARWDRVRR